MGAQRAYWRPVVAQATCELGQQGVLLDGVVDAAQIVGYGGQVAGRQLRPQRTGIEQRRRAGHEVKRRQDLVELYGPLFTLDFIQRQPHGHAHEKSLWQLDTLLSHVQEIAVKQCLQAKVVKLQVAFRLERRTQAGQVKLLEFFVEQLVFNALGNELREILGVAGCHFFLRHFFAQHFAAYGVHQQARRGVGVVRVFLDQRAGSKN